MVLPTATDNNIKRKPNRSHVKPYEPKEADTALCDELRTWREEIAQALFPLEAFRACGPALFMSNDTLKEIVNLAHAQKLTSLNALVRELHWSSKYIKIYGQRLPDIVNKYTPQITLNEPTAATSRTDDTPNAPATRKVRAPPCCSSCRKPGHNSMWFFRLSSY
jgi:hypothetical protein